MWYMYLFWLPGTRVPVYTHLYLFYARRVLFDDVYLFLIFIFGIQTFLPPKAPLL